MIEKRTVVAVILMLVSQRAEVEIVKMFGSVDAKRNVEAELAKQRGSAPSILEFIVILYVLGFIWQEMREVSATSNLQRTRFKSNIPRFVRNT